MAWAVGAYTENAELSVLAGTDLNALGSAAVKASAALDNSGNKDKYGDLFVHLDALSPGAGAHLDIYLLPSHDGTNYPSATAAVVRNQTTLFVGSIPLDTTAATAQDVVLKGIILPVSHYKIVLDNQSGVAIPSNNNSYAKMITYND